MGRLGSLWVDVVSSNKVTGIFKGGCVVCNSPLTFERQIATHNLVFAFNRVLASVSSSVTKDPPQRLVWVGV